MSLYIDPSFQAVALEEGTGAATALSGTDEYPSAVAVAPSDSPLTVAKVVDPGVGTVAALATLGGSDSAWDFGRCRFIAGGDRGICSLGVDSDKMKVSVRSLAETAVAAQEAMVSAPQGVFAAVAGGAVLLVGTAGRGVRTVWRDAEGSTVKALAWVAARNELVALCSDTCRVFCSDRDYAFYERTASVPQMLYKAGGEAFGAKDGALLCLSGEDADRAVPVALTVSTARTGIMLQPHAMTLDAAGSVQVAMLTLHGAGEAGATADIVCRLSFQGAVRMPLRAAVLSRPRCGLQVALQGRAAAGFIVRSFNLACR